MQVHDYLPILRKRWMSIVGVALLVLAAVAGVTLLLTPQYTATARLFFAVQAGESVSDLAQGSSFTERQMSSYAQIATWPLVLEPVIEDLGLDVRPGELAESVSAASPPNTVTLNVSVVDPDPEQAAVIANAVAEQIAEVAGTLTPERIDGTDAVRATIGARAEPPETPSSPNVQASLALGLALGVMLGIAVAILREKVDTKVRSEKDTAEVSAVPVIGTIAFDSSASANAVVMDRDPHGPRAEAMRRLRTNLQFVDVAGNPHIIVVTSSIPGEGKTTTAVNLAAALADAGSRVILVDADLRRPTVAKSMGLEGGAGLTTVLIGRAELADVVQPWNRTTLDVLAAGQVPPNPSELLGSRAMGALLDRLRSTYDIVLIDSPPLLPVTDTAVLSTRAGGVLVVAGADRLHKAQLREALSTLETVGAKVLGLVLNKVAVKQGTYSYAYRYEPTASSAPTQVRTRSASTPVRKQPAPPPSPLPSADDPFDIFDGADSPAATPESAARAGTWPGAPLSRRRP